MSTNISNPMVSIKNLGLFFKTKTYHDHSLRDHFTSLLKNPFSYSQRSVAVNVLFEDLSFDVQKGDIVGFLGRNGVGKTSLCRCIAGFYKPNHGEIKKNGQVRAVFDTALGIQPELTGRENAKILLEYIYPQYRSEHKEILEEALEFSELDSFLDAPYRIYSNGMQARLCLSLISSRPADILILDEVFDGADQFFRDKVSRRIENVMKSSGAVIFVSHSVDQLMRVCNRIIVFGEGGILFDGAPQAAVEFYNKFEGE